MSRVFPNVKILLHAQNFQWVQNCIFPHLMINSLINNVKFEMWSALSKLPILFSTVKLKLGHNFSQFTNRFKIGTL